MTRIEKKNIPGLEDPFINEDAVTDELINEMVEQIKDDYVKDFSIEERRVKLVENLSIDHIAKFLERQRIKLRDDNNLAGQVQEVLQRIRKRLIFKLLIDPEIDERDVYFIAEDKTKKSYEFEYPKEYDLEGENYYREFNPVSHGAAREKALNKLMPILKERPCPYVLRLKEFTEGSRIVKRKNMTDLRRLLLRKEEMDKNGMKFFLKYLLDAIKGTDFLSDNGLVLEDLHLENIGIDQEKDVGVLFDYDCLYLKGEMLKGRRVHYKHMPPESKSTKVETPTTEAEMVYQLGVCLRRIIEEFIQKVGLKKMNEELGVESVVKISERMTNENPEERGTLKETIEELEPLVMAA